MNEYIAILYGPFGSQFIGEFTNKYKAQNKVVDALMHQLLYEEGNGYSYEAVVMTSKAHKTIFSRSEVS